MHIFYLEASSTSMLLVVMLYSTVVFSMLLVTFKFIFEFLLPIPITTLAIPMEEMKTTLLTAPQIAPCNSHQKPH